MGTTSILIDLELLRYIEKRSQVHESRNSTLRRLLGLPPKPDMRKKENRKKTEEKQR